jgi:hypothetical protein
LGESSTDQQRVQIDFRSQRSDFSATFDMSYRSAPLLFNSIMRDFAMVLFSIKMQKYR